MKYPLIVLLASFILVSCAGKKGIQLGYTNQEECTDTVETAEGFAGETVQNIIFDHQGDHVISTLTVKTRCSSNLQLKLEDRTPVLQLRLSDLNKSADDCVCTKKISAVLNSIKPGTYNVEVTNSNGSELLITGSFSVLTEEETRNQLNQ